jgi:hypothetical protein
MSAGIVLGVLLLLWLPFKVIPAIFGHGSNFVATTLSSLFVSDNATSTSDVGVTNVNTENTNNKSGSNSNTTVNTASIQTQKVYYGKPDLEVTLISTGIIDPVSKQFVQTNYAGYNDQIAIKFQVKNIGTNVSGAWKLRINTPSRTTPTYDSDYQLSIKPGDRIVYTTSFDSPIAVGINTAYIIADPLNMIDESSENNNEITVPINVQGTSYSYNNNYNYGSNVAASNLPYGTLYSWTSMSVNCYASPAIASVGTPITWYSTISGGNGYYSYSWVGSDQLYSSESATNKIYYSPGTKTATITVTSNGQSVTKQCSTNIGYY